MKCSIIFYFFQVIHPYIDSIKAVNWQSKTPKSQLRPEERSPAAKMWNLGSVIFTSYNAK